MGEFLKKTAYCNSYIQPPNHVARHLKRKIPCWKSLVVVFVVLQNMVNTLTSDRHKEPRCSKRWRCCLKPRLSQWVKNDMKKLSRQVSCFKGWQFYTAPSITGVISMGCMYPFGSWGARLRHKVIHTQPASHLLLLHKPATRPTPVPKLRLPLPI